MKRTKLFMFTLVLALAAISSTMIVSADDCTRVVVTEADITRQAENTPPTDNWVLYTRTPASYGAFTVGPDTPPIGVGSLETRTPTGADKVFLNNYDYAGKLLSGISQLGYSTYQFSNSTPSDPRQLPAINIAICQNGVDSNGACLGFTTLVYEPVYNDGNQAVAPDVWQTWDAFGGVWWSTRPLNGMPCSGAVVACMQDLSTIIANNPNAVIISVGINQGSGNGGLNAATDALTLTYDGSCTTYDFEPFRVAATKDDCKDQNYKNFRRADGSTFKNQGQCIQYVNTGK